MKKILSVIIIGLLYFSTLSTLSGRSGVGMNATPADDPCEWTSKAPVPQPLDTFGSAIVDGKIFVIGGKGNGGSFLNTNYEYDPDSDNWSSRAPMPTARCALAVASVDNKIFAIGGCASNSGGTYQENEEYDPSTDNWTTKASKPTSRNWISAAVVSGKIYVFGGSDNNGWYDDTTEVYDPATDNWTTKTPSPNARGNYGIGVVNSRIYLIGGMNTTFSSMTLNEEYDLTTDNWTTKAPMPTALNGIAIAVVNNRIYAIGGATDANPWTNNLNIVEKYDPTTDTWTSVQPLQTARSCLRAEAVGRSIYAIGGWNGTFLDTNEELELGTPVGYWKFDEGSGAVAHDSSGNANDGTLMNGPQWVAGVSGTALSFDGVDDYLGISSSASLAIVGHQVTVETWFRPAVTIDANNTPFSNLIDKGHEYVFQMGQDGHGNPTANGKIWFAVILGNANGWNGIQTITGKWKAGVWYHLAGTYDGASLGIYVNGVLETSEALTGELYASSTPLSIGSVFGGSGDFTKGAMDEVKIYNYARTPGEIQADAQDWWPMFHHDLTHTGHSNSTAPATNRTSWIYTTGGLVESSPAVADGVVYVGSDNDNVYALNATTGKKIWNYTTGNPVVSSPAVADGVVYVGSDDTNVYALNATTSTQVWNYTTGNPVESSPAVADGVVYVGSDDGYVYALNATTGAQVWYRTGGGLVGSSPAVADGIVYVGSGVDDKVYALNATTGTKVWSYTTGSPVESSPAVADGKVFVGSCNNYVYALNATTGKQVWNYTTSDWVWSSPAVVDGVVYVGSNDGKVYAFGVHDVAVTNVTRLDVQWDDSSLQKTVVGQGYPLYVNVTVANPGGYPETFNVTLNVTHVADANMTIISTQTGVALAASGTATLTFTWNTTGYAYGNYTLTASADTVPGETYTANNNFTSGKVLVTIAGDLDGDGYVFLSDLGIMAAAWTSTTASANWNPNADIDADGYVFLSDLGIMAGTWTLRVTLPTGDP
jgi:outer membrane protein assembly factor BamB